RNMWRYSFNQPKIDPLKCVLCEGQIRFTGLKRGYRP
ncbi:hypothetical protein ACH175_004662, partial [Escherichia coli]